ncbi:hypothetical protein HOLleu_04494 [Holothuria leucospilota]|uniref:Uncharacterized protein n=1 Tax=Holothuria leucospilota TaxID=206669 RepID=A0A9Q1CTW7_HOLLE|nr:hypothetical protein HOLleu_04494 [Holothuria leucospilota]
MTTVAVLPLGPLRGPKACPLHFKVPRPFRRRRACPLPQHTLTYHTIEEAIFLCLFHVATICHNRTKIISSAINNKKPRIPLLECVKDLEVSRVQITLPRPLNRFINGEDRLSVLDKEEVWSSEVGVEEYFVPLLASYIYASFDTLKRPQTANRTVLYLYQQTLLVSVFTGLLDKRMLEDHVSSLRL